MNLLEASAVEMNKSVKGISLISEVSFNDVMTYGYEWCKRGGPELKLLEKGHEGNFPEP